MALQINTNLAALNARRNLDRSGDSLGISLQRLSSGLRINSAKDDAAGLAISDRLTSQIRGLNQAARNANDGISMLQVAEGAVQEVTDMLQRMRELSIEAGSGALRREDKAALQDEINQLAQEIDRISTDTSFGGRRLFSGYTGSITDPVKQPIIDGLKSYWLTDAENKISTYYGITASGGPDLDVVLYDDVQGGVAAFVSSGYVGNVLTSQSLNIDIQDFIPANLPDGGTAPVYNDRIIAHEMVHAYMARTMNLIQLATDTNKWFTEGAAEFIHGGDERLLGDIGAVDGNSFDAIVAGDYDAMVAKLGDGSVEGTYSAGYAAVRYMHSVFKAQRGTGVKEVMDYLSANPTLSLGDALFALGDLWGGGNAGGALTAFETAFKGATGSAFVQGMSLNNADTGAVGGFDADGGAVLTAQTVLPNVGAYSENPTALNVVFPDVSGGVGGEQIAFQVGSNQDEEIIIRLTGFSAVNLGIDKVDVTVDPNLAIVAIDRAISHVGKSRGEMGAVQNRLLSTISNLANINENVSGARSRILDADFAAESASLVRNQILQQAGISVLAQANTLPQLALSLLG